MKTIQELYQEVVANKELRDQLLKAFEAGKVEEFAKAHGCNSSLAEIKAFVKSKVSEHPILAMFI